MSATRSRLSCRQANGSTDQPGGHSAKNARRAGAPTTHKSSQEAPIMSTGSLPRQHTTRSSVPTLPEPPVIEGDCLSRRCPCSGWLAHNPRLRQYFYFQGVRFL